MKKGVLLSMALCCLQLIMYAQNVGIGTLTPTEKLHVTGNIKADTVKPNAIKFTPNAGAGKILTSDATGNANWQASSAAAAAGNTGFGVWGDCATNGNISEYNPVADSTAAFGDCLYGMSVSISGNYAIVGVPGDDVGNNNEQGSASIYQYNGNNWVLMQKITDAVGEANDFFGYSVSISGNYAVVGAIFDNVGANTSQGSASIYQYNGSNWVFMQKITDASGATSDWFGTSVSISGNYVIVGAMGDNVGFFDDEGSACIFQYNGSSWVLMQKIIDATGNVSDFAGASVSISGNYAIVGANRDDVGSNVDQGSVSIYQYNGSSWILMNKLTEVGGSANDSYGLSVSISGNYAIVGIPFDDMGANTQQGSAIIYQFNGSSWTSMQKLTDAGGSTSDYFGSSVSISGNYAIAGAYGDDIGINTNQGSVTIYQRVGPGWGKLQYITDPADNSADEFGSSTAIDGINKRFLISAPHYVNLSGKVVFGKIN